MNGKKINGLDKTNCENELPPEFKFYDKPLGFEQYQINIVFSGICHLSLVYYVFYLLPFGHVPKATLFLGFLYAYFVGFGVTAGAHRYWTHRSFKANLPLRILMMLTQTASVQYPIFKWCSEHRVHHKYSETDADPHNASRGFWFSHMSWWFQPKHPQVVEKLKTIDVSDLVADPVVRFQSKYYWLLLILMHWAFPMALCHKVFPDMSFLQIWAWNDVRWCYTYHVASLVNSLAHALGNKPYDQYIRPSENQLVSLFTLGEGWHNFHHTFPWDYKTAELGNKFDVTTMVLNGFAKIGWAYDLKTVSHKLLQERIKRTGDGSHPSHCIHANGKTGSAEVTAEEAIWGWGDEDLKKDDKEVTEILFPTKQG